MKISDLSNGRMLKVGDLVKLTFNDLIGIIIAETDEHGWFKVMDFNGNKWECNGVIMGPVDESR